MSGRSGASHVALVACLLGAALPAEAQDLPAAAPAAEARWSLFRRTPRRLARPLATDRPDRTESAYSIPAGWVQVEANVVAWSLDREGGELAREFGVAQVNVKVGLLPAVDLQLLTELWSRQTLSDDGIGEVARAEGRGLAVARLKVNLWGNDGGRSALAVMPYAGAVRQDAAPGAVVRRHPVAGLIVPFALDLGREWSLGAMLELDLQRDRPGTWRGTFVQSLTVGRPIAGALAGYAELFHASGGGPRELTLDGGLALGLTADLQLDAGVNVGLTRGADDVNPFLGVAVRF